MPLTSRLVSVLAVSALVGLVGCGGEASDDVSTHESDWYEFVVDPKEVANAVVGPLHGSRTVEFTGDRDTWTKLRVFTVQGAPGDSIDATFSASDRRRVSASLLDDTFQQEELTRTKPVLGKTSLSYRLSDDRLHYLVIFGGPPDPEKLPCCGNGSVTYSVTVGFSKKHFPWGDDVKPMEGRYAIRRTKERRCNGAYFDTIDIAADGTCRLSWVTGPTEATKVTTTCALDKKLHPRERFLFEVVTPFRASHKPLPSDAFMLSGGGNVLTVHANERASSSCNGYMYELDRVSSPVLPP